MGSGLWAVGWAGRSIGDLVRECDISWGILDRQVTQQGADKRN